MHRKPGSMWFLSALAVTILVGAGIAQAQEDSLGTSAGPQADGLPAPSEPDTVRTNLWLTEALMGEIVTASTAGLPATATAVRLMDQGGGDGDELFGAVATRLLGESGHELYLAPADSTLETAVDYIYSYRVVGVELSYPEVGRTLGIWQRWVARDLSVSAAVELSEADSGRLLFKDIVERRFSDRVDNSDFDEVGSEIYDFTTAEKAGSGWQNRMEEIIVLGTLVALIAVYFSNTGS